MDSSNGDIMRLRRLNNGEEEIDQEELEFIVRDMLSKASELSPTDRFIVSKASRRLFSEELNAVITMLKISDCCATFVTNHILDVDGLLAALSDEEVCKELRLPPLVKKKLLLQFETRMEFYKLQGEAVAHLFFERYPNISKLQATKWDDIDQLVASSFGAEEKELVRKLWCSTPSNRVAQANADPGRVLLKEAISRRSEQPMQPVQGGRREPKMAAEADGEPEEDDVPEYCAISGESSDGELQADLIPPRATESVPMEMEANSEESLLEAVASVSLSPNYTKANDPEVDVRADLMVSHSPELHPHLCSPSSPCSNQAVQANADLDDRMLLDEAIPQCSVQPIQPVRGGRREPKMAAEADGELEEDAVPENCALIAISDGPGVRELDVPMEIEANFEDLVFETVESVSPELNDDVTVNQTDSSSDGNTSLAIGTEAIREHSASTSETSPLKSDESNVKVAVQSNASEEDAELSKGAVSEERELGKSPKDVKRVPRTLEQVIQPSKKHATTKKYSDLLIDRFFSPALKESDPTSHMMYCLRYRMQLSADSAEESDYDDPFLGGRSGSSSASSLYDTLLKLLEEYAAAGRSEIFRLLVERRSAIPLFLPNGEHHLSLLRSVFKEVGPERTICLGEDATLMRVAIVSCRDKSQSQSSELLHEVFNIESLHGEDLSIDSITAQHTTAEIGLGCAKKTVVDHPDTCKRQKCQCSKKSSVVHFLVLHVVGEFEPLCDFVQEFADYLIVEDSTEETGSFHRRFVNCINNNLKTMNIVVWRTSTKPLATEWEDTERNYGFRHLLIHSPSGERLFKALAQDVMRKQDEMTGKFIAPRPKLHRMTLPPLREVEFPDIEVDNVVNGLRNFTTIRSEEFVLQKSFCRQGDLEIEKAQFQNDKDEREKIDQLIKNQIDFRKKQASVVRNHPLIVLLMNILNGPNPVSTRIFSYRKLEMSLAQRADSLLKPIRSEISRLNSEFAEMSQSKGQNDSRVREARKKLLEAKSCYNMAVVSPEHIWREMSHVYAADHSKYRAFPELAAQHLIDGMSIELLDGDSNMVNLTWIKAVLNELDRRLKRNEQPSRIFVLSVMGVQSSGKSTLLNIMFGIRMKTSVGQCTRGINMQLIPVVDRSQYDFILLLDTEGTRSPEHWGLEGSEKRDNQMATVSILLADATIIVNPGENDAAIKEILPIVLLAYQGSKLAEEKGGQMSSMVFFVYNRIDTQQKDKLSDILQILGSSLHDAFKEVSKLVGTDVQSNDVSVNPFSLFRQFKLDASNSKESDVRILGNIKKSFTPPDDVPDPAYGEALAEFWQHIHSRVTGPSKWKSRTLSDFQNYLDLVWNCLISADFTLNFKNVLERSAYDQMNKELKGCEKQLSEEYRTKFGDIETEILESKRKASPQKNSNVGQKDFCQELARNVQPTVNQLDKSVATILSDPRREKWKLIAESSWNSFKKEQKNHWNGLLETFVNFQLKYDDYVEQYKIDMRKKIRQLFSSDEAVRMSQDEKDHKFREMYEEVLQDAWNKHSSVNVSERVKDVYRNSPVIKQLPISVFDVSVEQKMDQAISDIFTGGPNQMQNSDASWWSVFSGLFSSKGQKGPKETDGKREQKEVECCTELYEKIMNWLLDKKCFVDSVVDEVINITTAVTTSKQFLRQSELQKAHIFAKRLVTRYMANVHSEWEDKNSVYAKLNQEESRSEMKAYFDQASQGVVDIKLLIVMLRSNLEKILPEAFDEEMLLLTMDKVSSRNWLLDPKAMLNYMDLELIKLLDRNQLGRVLDKLKHPQQFYEEVLIKLIGQELPDLDHEWDSFCSKIKRIVESAASTASKETRGRAKRFIREVPLLGKTSGFRGKNFLAKKFTTDGDGYDGCDHEEAEEFRQQLTESLLQAVDHSMKRVNCKLAEKVLSRLREERTEEGARPRCNEPCPHCYSLCILPFGHGSAKKHDTFHQPRGLTGVCWAVECNDETAGTLPAFNCSTVEAGVSFRFNGNWIDYKDFGTVYPDWMQPTFMEHLPLREYIFATYHKEIAARYRVKPSVDIPPEYLQHNLDNIRYDLQQKTNTLPPRSCC